MRGVKCFNCNRLGHMARDCKAPKREPTVNSARVDKPTARGRVFTMNGAEASNSKDLIKGSCNIAGNLLTVLFDSGATHSFISVDCVKLLELPVSSLPYDLIVLTPTAEPVAINTVCLNCPIVIQDRHFLVDLICLPLVQRDVILGMDRLSSNHVLLDCAHRTLTFPDPEISGFLFTKQAKTISIGKGQESLLLTNLEAEEEVDVSMIHVVKDFPEVFPNDVPGLPPVRGDIEFSIDLVPGTGPISIALYRMSPTELVELKAQLEDLLSKQFIRPIVSP